ncbi:capsular polysaccharide export protein, LipB/KpsS family [Halopiger xanaduensis]|uniref:capsular polysaccharide export protein, LipB/KpsS family n=1 Tax=Halopiger xanaduensis TaxID=387343 RepID=UPI000677C7F5|nr:hypothetical protein [Halopiger xanaduensis]
MTDTLGTTTRDEYDTVYSVLSNADVDLDTPVPIYEQTWRHLLASRHGRLQELTLLYLRLQEVVESEDPDRLVCDRDLDTGYLSVAIDISDAYDIPIDTQGQQSVSRLQRIQRFLKNTVLVLPFLFDQFVSLLLGFILGRPEKAKLALIPSFGRFDSMGPAIDKISNSGYDDYAVIGTSHVSSLGATLKWKYLKSELDGEPLVSLSRFVTLRCIGRQIRSYIDINRGVLFGKSLKRELNDELESEVGITLEKTIEYSIYDGFRTRDALSIFYYHLADNMMSKLECEKAVIGGLPPSRRAMLWAGLKNDVEMYYIPHGAGVVMDSSNPPAELTQFVSGDLEKRHYEESQQVETQWECIVSGRSYLTTLYEEYKGVERTPPEDGDLQLLIATQPIRGMDEVIRDILTAVAERPDSVSIVIKTHPSESAADYADYARGNEQVTVTESDLFTHLSESDLTVTINSNVGIESVLAGTPTVSVNKWDPITDDALYAIYGEIPVLRDQQAVFDLIENLDADSLNELYTTQYESVSQNYELDTDAAENMKTEILSG